MVGGDELEKLRLWRFRRRAWWSAMEHDVTWVEAEEDEMEIGVALDILGPKAITKNETFFILIC